MDLNSKLPDATIELLYEEGAILVFNKPAGLLTQAPPGIDSLEHRVREWLRLRDNKTGKFYLAVTHRLDRPVSGAIIFARNVRAARRINEQFKFRTVKKIYRAVVEGNIEQKSGQWQDWVCKIPEVAKSEVVDREHPEAKDAHLEYTVLNCKNGMSHIEVELGTGRSHQIRLQAASRGYPIVGDELYGASKQFGPVQDDHRKRPIALHAHRLSFEHPMLHEQININCELPPIFRELLFQNLL